MHFELKERIAALEKQSKQKDIQLIQKDQEITQMRAKLFNEEKLIRYLHAEYPKRILHTPNYQYMALCVSTDGSLSGGRCGGSVIVYV